MKKFDQINVIPFIDIMLVLLAIVLLTASFVQVGALDITLPSAENSPGMQKNSKPQMITADANEIFYLNDQIITLPELESLMTHWDKNAEIILKIDAKTSFQLFVSLSDLLKKNALNNISVLTQQ